MKAVSIRRFAVPLGAILGRFTFGLLVGAAVLLMVLDHLGNPVVDAIRVRVVDTVVPALAMLGRPVAAARGVADEAGRVLDIWHDNARLREENARLLQWQDVARRLAVENETLRALARVVPEPHASFVTARVVATSGGAFVRTLLIGAGEREGIVDGQAVIAPEGLVGRIVEVGRRTARVLLLTDLNSRVPIRVETTRAPAILAGDNSERMRLQFLPEDATVRVGDRVVTSGEGGLIPPGLAGGIVTEVIDDMVILRPLVDANRLEFVTVLDYAVPGILPETREAGPLEPPW
ncbi:MAG: rod shape-determining protein MreC [Alphaproteobacteria bacterium]